MENIEKRYDILLDTYINHLGHSANLQGASNDTLLSIFVASLLKKHLFL
jgi:hypothetical protein